VGAAVKYATLVKFSDRTGPNPTHLAIVVVFALSSLSLSEKIAKEKKGLFLYYFV